MERETSIELATTTTDGCMALKEGASATKLIVMTIGHYTRPAKSFIR
jgi:hypothetical protein